jgi:hypothetical protein
MKVSLTPELERFVDAKVERGLYNNASEVVREDLRCSRSRMRCVCAGGLLDEPSSKIVSNTQPLPSTHPNI